MGWVVAGALWAMLALIVGVIIGRGIRLADQAAEAASKAGLSNFVVEGVPSGLPDDSEKSAVLRASRSPTGEPTTPSVPSARRESDPSQPVTQHVAPDRDTGVV